jgi:VWFA-related protein
LKLIAILYLPEGMRITVALLIFAVVLFGQEPLSLRVDVSLVTVDVEVTDAVGRPVTTLKKEDFQVLENGAAQTVRSFDAVDTPYSILLLFDCSNSTESNWPFLVQAMSRFRRMLRPQDQISIAQFGGGYKTVRKFFRPDEAGDIGIDVKDPGCGGTDFYGAVDRSLAELKVVKGRKGVVVLSDGQHVDIPDQPLTREPLRMGRLVDAADDKEFQKLLKAVAASDVAYYFVAVNTDLNSDDLDVQAIYNRQQIRSRLELLASRSGGHVVYPTGPEEVVKLYEQLARSLGTSYSLGYVPDNAKKDGTFRKIEVRVTDKALKVRQSREGYADIR